MAQVPKPASHPAVTAFVTAVGRRPFSFAFSKVTNDSFNMLKLTTSSFLLDKVLFQ